MDRLPRLRMLSEGPRDLTAFIEIENGRPTFIQGGGYGEIWTGLYRDKHCSMHLKKVAVKHLRSRSSMPADVQKLQARLWREISVWQRLRHEHVLPLLGTVSIPLAGVWMTEVGMVSKWMEHGDLHQYLKDRSLTDAQRLTLFMRMG
ncbi:hypothetical protein HWV62_11888 [Athelia sp. TMB]|nr:hypothetical protein HWV62_11888 [Athelia sp. TMB]